MKEKEELTFEELAKIVHQYLKEDGWRLNFKGYKETIRRYFDMVDNHLLDVYDLAVECHLWAHYFGELEGFIAWKKEEWLLETERLKAFENIANPDPVLDRYIQMAQERFSHFRLFEKHIKTQRQFFEKAYFHCLEEYMKGNHVISREE